MKKETYWKLKAALLQHEAAMLKLQQLAAQATTAKNDAMREAGLDPAVVYVLDDTTCTVTVRRETATAPPSDPS